MKKDSQEQPSTDYQLLAADDPASLLDALVTLKVCLPGETITSVAKAGEGNMNLVLRVTTDRQSVIVKQARPWVEKYPAIAAADERILSEIEFYRCISTAADVRSAMPAVIASIPAQRILVLEDLGASSDYANLYGSDVAANEVDSVFELAIGWLIKLHQCDIRNEQQIGCEPLLKLNHQHIFSIPLLDPPEIDLDLVCAGLASVGKALSSDAAVQQAMQHLGAVYLKGGGGLLHGDYYPGSWLATESGFRVIDPEFCFCGPSEFDLGVLAAHWIFCGSEADGSTIDRVCRAYTNDVSRKLIEGFAGAELIRRLTGVAQLPLDADLTRRQQWLECGVEFLRGSV